MIFQYFVPHSIVLYCFAPHHEAKPCPINRVFIFSQQSMIERKDTVTGRGNHEKVAGHLQTGSVRSQGETSLTLFLLTVHHFVCKIALAGLWLHSHPYLL